MCDGVEWKVIETLKKYAVGDTGPAGGVVFYVTDGGSKGMEAIKRTSGTVYDDTVYKWGCYQQEITGANGTSIGTGRSNTIAIINSCGEADIAAKVAHNCTYGGYTDWFLPARDTLTEIHKAQLPDWAGTLFYWSSSQYQPDPAYSAWYQHFAATSSPNFTGKNSDGGVYAVREF